jgi:hypothetical protein
MLVFSTQLPAQALPTPESVLGHKPGDDFYLASYDEALNYFQKLAAATDKMRLINVGKTSEGRDWYIAIISSAENLKNVERYRDIARRIALVQGLTDEQARALAREGKVIVHVDGGLHSTEVAGHQHTIQLAYNLVSGERDPNIRQILDNVVLVLWFSLNPDGQNMVSEWYRRNLGTPYEVSPMPWLYQKYVGHDNNRDGYMNNSNEQQIVTRVNVREWFPMVIYNHHQTAPFPARIWIPPFAEPVSSNVHPLIWRWTNVFGTAMASYLDQHDMPGSIHRTGFDDWYPGFLDGVNNYRNAVSFLTETALYQYATPRFYTVQDFPRDFQDLRQQVFYSSPWKGGWWRLGDAVRYMIGASMSVLDTAAKFKEELIYNRYQAGRDVIRRFSSDPPFAYLIPQRQRDPQTAAVLVEKLQINGINISQAAQPIRVNGRDYPEGTWVVMMDQPFALLAKELLETQNYPDLRESPGGAPDLPYDVAGWTLPLQMGVEVAAVTTPLPQDFRARIKAIDKIVPPAGALEGTGPAFVFDHRPNVSFRAVNRIFKEGGTISLLKKETKIGDTSLEAGSFVASGISPQKMQTITNDLSLKVYAARNPAEPATPVKNPRIGLYRSWIGNIDEGWTSWLFDQFEFSYREARNDEIRAGHLRDAYDVLVFAEMGANAIMEGRQAGTVPGQYAGGIGESGLENVREFVQQGGTVLTLGNASLFAIEKFKLPVKNVLEGLKSQEFFCAGSILRTEARTGGHPLLYGLPASPAVFFARNGAFDTQGDFKGSVLLSYPKDENPLASGYLLHPERIQGKAAALDVIYGKGHVILTGFRPQWRGQTHLMFKFLFNSLYHFGDAAAVPEPAPGVARSELLGEWDRLAKAIRADLEKAFAQNEKYAGARGAQAQEEGRRYDAIVEQFQSAHFPAIDRLKERAGAGTAGRRLDEYKSQLKAALVDMRGKDYSSVKFSLNDLMLQFRLTALQQEIADLMRSL